MVNNVVVPNGFSRIVVILSKRSLCREGSGRAARSVTQLSEEKPRRNNRAFGSLPY
jgi:hypothetical protein